MLLIERHLYRFHEFELQPSARTFLRAGERVGLAPKTFEVLVCLVERAGRVVSKDELLKVVWPESFVEEGNLTQHVFSLRKALGDKAECIVTLPGRGYQFTAKVTVVDEAEEKLEATALTGPGVRIQRISERTHVLVEETVPASLLLPDPMARNRHLQKWLAMAVLLLMVSAAWGGWYWRYHGVVRGDHHEVVVTFQNSTGDPGFDGGLKRLLIADLSRSPFFLLRGKGSVAESHGVPAPANATVEELCKQNNGQAVLAGTIAARGPKFDLTLTARECPGGRVLAQTAAVAEDKQKVAAAVDLMTRQMRRRLGESEDSIKATLAGATEEQAIPLEAWSDYAKGEDMEAARKFEDAIPLYKKAIALAPEFAAAYAGLASVYWSLLEDDLGVTALIKAYDLRGQTDEPTRLNIVSSYERVVTGNWLAERSVLEDWTARFPLETQPWLMLAQVNGLLGRFDLSVVEANHALELDGGSAAAYDSAATAYLMVGQADRAKALCLEARRRQIDGVLARLLLFKVGAVQQDVAAMDEQIAWSKGRKDEHRMIELQAYLALSQGKVRQFDELWQQTLDMSKAQKLEERADTLERGLPRMQAEMGLIDAARRTIEKLGPVRDHTAFMIALAEVGKPDEAEAELKEVKEEEAERTLVTFIRAPQVRAAIDLARQKPVDAIAELELARPYDLRSYETTGLRANAYLAARQPTKAAVEWMAMISRPGINPLSYHLPLAHLGLARCYVMEGNPSAARAEYETLFRLWKDADADLPPLVAARAEYAKLSR